MKIKVFFKFIVFYCFLWPFKGQNFFPGPVLCKYLWHNFKTWKLLSKINFSFDLWLVLGNEDKIMICPFFKFSALEHFCGLKLISWVDIWVVLIFVSGLIWKENLKNGQNVLEKWHNVVMRYYSHLFQRRPREYKEPTIWLWQCNDVWVFFMNKL